MKGRYTSEVKHKVQKLLIRDLRTGDQGRYTCRYQQLESSADLWVEGLYLEPIRTLTNLFPVNPDTNGGWDLFSSWTFAICLFVVDSNPPSHLSLPPNPQMLC